MTENTTRDETALWYLAFAIGVVILAVAGYVGYVLYPRFDLPAVTGAGLLVLAAGAGIASFFSPCAFPLLVTLLARESGTAQERPRSIVRPIRFGVALAGGASLFLLLIGAGIAAGAAPRFEAVTFTSMAGRLIRFSIGVILIVLGLMQIGIVSAPFGVVEKSVRPLLKAQAHLRRERPTLGFALFGFGYILAGFG